MGRDARELRSAWTRYQRHAFHAPSSALAPWVEHYWEARWDYAEPYRQKIVPYPNVHLSFGGGRAAVSGVCSGYQVKVLEGRDHVFGVAFRPGCFRPFLGADLSLGPSPDPNLTGNRAYTRAHFLHYAGVVSAGLYR